MQELLVSVNTSFYGAKGQILTSAMSRHLQMTILVEKKPLRYPIIFLNKYILTLQYFMDKLILKLTVSWHINKNQVYIRNIIF